MLFVVLFAAYILSIHNALHLDLMQAQNLVDSRENPGIFLAAIWCDVGIDIEVSMDVGYLDREIYN